MCTNTYITNMEFSEESGNQMVDEHTLSKLREIAEKYNKLPIADDCEFHNQLLVENMTDRPKHSYIPQYETKEEYIFALWMRDVEIPHVLTFGEKYDESFFDCTSCMFFEDFEEEHEPSEEEINEIVDVHNNNMYKIFINDKYYASFLYDRFYNISDGMIRNNSIKFQKLNEITKDMIKNIKTKKYLEKYNKLDLLYMMLDLSNYRYINYEDYLNFIEYLPK